MGNKERKKHTLLQLNWIKTNKSQTFRKTNFKILSIHRHSFIKFVGRTEIFNIIIINLENKSNHIKNVPNNKQQKQFSRNFLIFPRVGNLILKLWHH